MTLKGKSKDVDQASSNSKSSNVELVNRDLEKPKETNLSETYRLAKQKSSSLSTGQVLQLQRTIGNRAVRKVLGLQPRLNHPRNERSELAASRDSGGFKPELSAEDETQDAGGTLGDIARPVGTAVGNVVGSVAGAVTGISVSSNTTTAAGWHDHGFFRWVVGFNTTGRNGWLVQRVVNQREPKDAAGTALPDGLTPRYWEAWAVDGSGTVTPGSGGSHDWWQRRSWGDNTQGTWSMTGRVYFTQTDPATQGFTDTAVPEAGGLLASTSAPTGLGVARLHRYAQGTWDSTGTTKTHTGSAGP